MVKLLGISAIVFILAISTGNSIFFVNTFTIFIIITVLNMYNLWFKNGKFDRLVKFNDDKVIEEFKDKKYFRCIIRFISLPMCVVGTIFYIFILYYYGSSCL